MKYYVYILTNRSNKVLYIGITNNISRRIFEHRSESNNGFTKRYHIHKLVYFEEYQNPAEAIAREKQLKGFLRIKKIELIEKMNPSWDDMSQFL